MRYTYFPKQELKFTHPEKKQLSFHHWCIFHFNHFLDPIFCFFVSFSFSFFFIRVFFTLFVSLSCFFLLSLFLFFFFSVPCVSVSFSFFVFFENYFCFTSLSYSFYPSRVSWSPSPFLFLHRLFLELIFLNSFLGVLEIPCVSWFVISLCISLLCKSIWNNNFSLGIFFFTSLHLYCPSSFFHYFPYVPSFFVCFSFFSPFLSLSSHFFVASFFWHNQ